MNYDLEFLELLHNRVEFFEMSQRDKWIFSLDPREGEIDVFYLDNFMMDVATTSASLCITNI